MIVIIKKDADCLDINNLKDQLKQLCGEVTMVPCDETTVLSLGGDTARIDIDLISRNPIVERAVRIAEPYKLSSRKLKAQDTVLDVGGRLIGGQEIAVMAGPCSVESKEQILSIARSVKGSGALFLRGGAFKPRTSPYAFQGMGLDGLKLLSLARQETGLPIVSEIMSVTALDAFVEAVDIIQVGARNMQNFDLLKELSKINKPVLLKRGLSSTVEELLMSAEYIMAGGNQRVILCERGIRTFETKTRNTLDLSAVPVLKSLSHLPVIVDPSHATGRWDLVRAMSLASVAAGADGLLIEVHDSPETALCDGAQSIKPRSFKALMGDMAKVASAVDRTLNAPENDDD